MKKIIEKVKDGFEQVVEMVDKIISDIDEAKNNELEEFKLTLDEKYADRVNRCNKIREDAIELVEIEVEEENEPEQNEPTENTDGQPVEEQFIQNEGV